MSKIYFLILGILTSVLFTLIYFVCQVHLEYDMPALMVANILLTLLSVASYFMLQSKIKTGRPQAFVNGVYGATLLRLMVCMGSIFLYLFANKGHLHQPSIFSMMGLYVIYTAFETITLSKIAKK
jgi:hypothetical protein